MGVTSETDESSQSHSDDVGHPSDSVPMTESGRLRFRAEVVLDDPQYAGKKINRKAAFATDSSSEDGDGNSEDEAELDRKLEYEGSDGVYDEGDQTRSWGGEGAQNDELMALSKEYQELREEELKVLDNLRDRDTEDHAKGQAVKNQKLLWDKALETRILLQKLVSGANRLPQGQSKEEFSESQTEVAKAYAMLLDSAYSTLDCLLDLEKGIIDRNEEISVVLAENVHSANRKREEEALSTGPDAEHQKSYPESVEAAWNKLSQLYSSIAQYRDSSVDRWQRKTQLLSGAAARGKLRAFNQSISQQVSTIMKGPSRVITRTMPKRTSIHVLGQPPEVTTDNRDQKVSKSVESIAAYSMGNNLQEEDLDPECFDDSEFYQQLLHEFLDSSTMNALGNGGLHPAKNPRSKKRKAVDRRASKGRKIRYTVLEPLLNFMAPEPMVITPIADRLFANLFGIQNTKSKSDRMGISAH